MVILTFLYAYQHDGKHDLKCQNDRHTYGKFGVLRFVPEGVHAGKGTDAAADHSHTDESGFGDPPFLFPGFLFIGKHKKEGNRIDYEQIGY